MVYDALYAFDGEARKGIGGLLCGVDEAGTVRGTVTEDDDDDVGGELTRKIMVVDGGGACIGCGACERVCPKACQTHVAHDKLAA